MTAPQADSEQVRYDVIIEAKAALQVLREMLKLTDDNNMKIVLFAQTVKQQSEAMGVSWKQLLGVYKQLNAELSQGHKATLFGNVGGQDLMGKTEEYMQSLDQAGRLEDQVAKGATSMGNAGEQASSRFSAGLHLVRIALGALEAMLLFNIVQAIQQTFATAIKNAQDYEASLYRLHNAERILSNEGIDISTKGLEEGILRVKKLLPIFSKEDIAGMVGQVAITTKSLGLTEKQIVDLAQAIGVLNVNSVQDETLQQTAQKVLSSLLTNNAKGVADLGIKLGDAAIQAKALEMGLLRAGQSASDLSDHEKSIVKVAIAIQAGSDSVAGLNEYLDTNTAKIQSNKAAWNDLLTSVGQIILPFIPAVTALFNGLNDSVNVFKTLLAAVLAVLLTFLTTIRMVANGSIKSLDDLKKKFHEIAEGAKELALRALFPNGVPENAPNWFKDFASPYLKQKNETPTNPNGSNQDEASAEQNKVKMYAEAESKIQDILRESADKKQDIETQYSRKLEDIATGYQQKIEDIARETAQKREDALRNYNQKVDDINRQADESEAQARQDSRQREIDREKEFQQKLKELREKFLFDLEDALRERDARQVLRLIRQYNLDKKNLEDRHKLDEQQAKRDLAFKLKQIEQERQLKLQAAQREYQDKLQEIAIGEQRAMDEAALWKQRQTQDAQIWYQRQLADYRQYLQRKLQDLAQALMKEYQLTAAGAAAIYQLLSTYFGAGGSISQLLGSSLSTSMNGILSGSSTGSTGTTGSTSGGGGFPVFHPNGNGTGYAEGGTYLATRPTKLLVGEKGAEQVNITPLAKPGNNVGKIFGDRSMAGMGGDVRIRMELSPDLEAKIIDTSLDSVSLSIEKLLKSK